MIEEITEYIEREIISDSVELSRTDDLLVSGLIDSMGIMKLVGFIESTFNIVVPPEDITIENFENIEAISNYLANNK